MKLVLDVWRQADRHSPGRFVRYHVASVLPEDSVLDVLDRLNGELLARAELPVAFESDCREGICGACGVVVDGRAHGGESRATTCETRVGKFADGATLRIEPFRARAFPVLRDLIVDRSALDRVIASGGYVSVRTGNAPEANVLPVPKEIAEQALDAAACIGCGACVAACPNASAALFVGAKVTHLALLPQGGPERRARAAALVAAADREGFGACSSYGECHAACPKGIELGVITRLGRELLRAGGSGS
ncbi:MAG TPA: succinate dehydrogenase/fumarate reductase iron-sulfur subunit [Polyangiaceae bacterium]|jgi:succinate dehydrogenase / fumarate reductase iron-sulfur subunit|nr:succinate dehydrogenase/fumarate reductase iron-sulfur subunit [Polyangiaceae bacterium]